MGESVENTTGKKLRCHNPGCGKSFDENSNSPGTQRNSHESHFDNIYSGDGQAIVTYVSKFEFYNRVDSRPFDINCPGNVKVNIEPTQLLVEAISQLNHLEIGERPLNDQSATGIIAPGVKCRRNGCTKVFSDSFDFHDQCIYHSGIPIFHDGGKYWSCCQIRKSDFNEFLRQVGCCQDKHDFTSPPKLLVEFNYGSKRKNFSKIFNLFEEVVPENSLAIATPYKLEIKLVPVNLTNLWSTLEYSS